MLDTQLKSLTLRIIPTLKRDVMLVISGDYGSCLLLVVLPCLGGGVSGFVDLLRLWC